MRRNTFFESFEQVLEDTLAKTYGLFGLSRMEVEVRTFAEYGQPFEGTTAKVVPKGGTWSDSFLVPIVGWAAESAFIRDNREGVLAVAEACGFGHPAGIENWADYAQYGYTGPEQGTQPILFLSSETAGYRALASGAWPFERIDALNADESRKFWHDVWRLDVENSDHCVIAVQSASSGSTVLAEYGWDEEYSKLGWRIYLISPVLEGGEVYQGWYAETFRKATIGYYRRLHER